MPTASNCLRVTFTFPLVFGPNHATPGAPISRAARDGVQTLVTNHYGGLTILQPYPSPFAEGWWENGGLLYGPENNALVDVVTSGLPGPEAVENERSWAMDVLYPAVQSTFGEIEIFMLLQHVERVR